MKNEHKSELEAIRKHKFITHTILVIYKSIVSTSKKICKKKKNDGWQKEIYYY